MGFSIGFRVTTFPSRFTDMMASRYRGERASPMHQGDRNCTYTQDQVIKDQMIQAPHP
jgi:hypothetical protein